MVWSAPSDGTTAAHGRRRRESATAVVQRLHAVPVQLLPSHVFGTPDDSGGDAASRGAASRSATASNSVSAACSELGASSVCVVTASTAPAEAAAAVVSAAACASPLVAPAAAEQCFAYEVVAAHVLRGGRALYVAAPASGAFSLVRFAVVVERQWLALHPEAELPRREAAVLQAVGRLEVLVCASVADVCAVCQAYTFPTTESGDPPHAVPPPTAAQSGDGHGSGQRSSSGPAQQPADVVPLCVVAGVSGPVSTAALLERAVGRPAPLPHYLLCLLQRRLRCALVVLEAGVPSAALDSGRGRRAATTSSAAWPRPGGLPSTAALLAASDLVQRLRAPHVYPPRGDVAAPLPAPSARRGSIEDALDDAADDAMKQRAGRVAPRLEGDASARHSLPPPVSLHQVHLSFAYVECEGMSLPPRPDRHRVDEATPLLLSLRMGWRYRVHVMRATVVEAAGESPSGGGGGVDLLRSRRGGAGAVAVGAAAVGSRRRLSGTSGGPQYSGTWVRSSAWRCM
ncbi:hypothetical protein NESM_000658600 [Novymonas esmeraldas]|uniref:Uncharacterized protein n=1 Tax=Novymonas esmeraldas TaxID=1808958 RepID=A0AAW0EUN0_9TRYP